MLHSTETVRSTQICNWSIMIKGSKTDLCPLLKGDDGIHVDMGQDAGIDFQ